MNPKTVSLTKGSSIRKMLQLFVLKSLQGLLNQERVSLEVVLPLLHPAHLRAAKKRVDSQVLKVQGHQAL